ncbi:hypothetical protein O9929_01220 [Vibrio lentus]|nr:hypothetical protein [Vibrio lentus]
MKRENRLSLKPRVGQKLRITVESEKTYLCVNIKVARGDYPGKIASGVTRRERQQ